MDATGLSPRTISGYSAASGYESAARNKLARKYSAYGVRLRKGRVEIRRASSTGWSWFDVGSLEAIRRDLYPHRTR